MFNGDFCPVALSYQNIRLQYNNLFTNIFLAVSKKNSGCRLMVSIAHTTLYTIDISKIQMRVLFL